MPVRLPVCHTLATLKQLYARYKKRSTIAQEPMTLSYCIRDAKDHGKIRTGSPHREGGCQMQVDRLNSAINSPYRDSSKDMRIVCIKVE